MRQRLKEFRSRLRAEEAALGRLVPRWVPPLLGFCTVALIPWTIALAIDLPERTVAHHWDLAWVVFDIAIAAGLGATAYTVLRRPSLAEMYASVTGTLLLVDAWFDVMTAAPGTETGAAIASAALAEVPLAILCFVIARNIERVTRQAGRYLRAAGFTIESGNLVPPRDPGAEC